jgi:hypothetical protein
LVLYHLLDLGRQVAEKLKLERCSFARHLG